MKQATFIILFLCLFMASKAQQRVSYAYDAAGNRISRTIVLKTRASNTLENAHDSVFFQEILAEKQIRIYPNPVQSVLKIAILGYKSSMKGEYALLNISGVMLKRGAITQETTLIDMSNYLRGTYILNLSLNKQSTSWKIIKQ